mmetsp:Transcript_52433/g.126933  ORF Transcript_52433/g.126933 Transcript_52433/m.126933 type:complete len:136 (+) Transcript_52433:2416-2823(+)
MYTFLYLQMTTRRRPTIFLSNLMKYCTLAEINSLFSTEDTTNRTELGYFTRLLYIRFYFLFFRLSSNRHKVDAIPISRSIRKVVAQMSSSRRDGFTVVEASYVFPIDFVVSEGRPTMTFRFFDKVLHRPADRGRE